jgi:hypothetical protein
MRAIIILVSFGFIVLEFIVQNLNLPLLDFVLVNDSLFLLKLRIQGLKVLFILIKLIFETLEFSLQFSKVVIKGGYHAVEIANDLVYFTFHLSAKRLL